MTPVEMNVQSQFPGSQFLKLLMWFASNMFVEMGGWTSLVLTVR